MKRAGRLAALACSALLFGCPGPASSDAGTETETCTSNGDVPAERLQVGTFPATTFVPIPEGAPMTIYRGPQGGMHILVSVQLYATMGTAFVHEMELTHARDGSSLGGRIVRGKTCTPGTSLIRDIPVFVTTATAAPARLRVRTSVLDDQETTLETLSVEASLRLVP